MKLKYGLVAILLFILLFSSQIAYMLTEWSWFGSVGYSSVFTTMISAKLMLFAASALIFGIISYINLSRIKDRPNHVFWVLVIVSIFFGLVTQFGWERLLLALNAQPFYVQDPLFHKDVGFYVFTLPFLWLLWNTIFAILLINLVITAAMYIFAQVDMALFNVENIEYAEIAKMIPKRAQSHLAALLGILALLFSFRYLLDRFELLYSETGVVYGAGYTDVNANLPFLYIYAAVAFIVALLLFAFAAGQRSSRVLMAIVGIILVTGALGAIYPTAIQQYSVAPNEIVMEEPYIAHNINYTIQAYGLSDIDEIIFPIDYNLSTTDLNSNKATLDNIRLWDHRPLLKTYRQLQEIRLYYEFLDVDVDRYVIDGNKRQVMLSARELSQDQLPEQARNWLNTHLVYTHGYGICMSPANEVTSEGMPNFYIKNLPPESSVGEILRPEIYYGEGNKEYLVVNTNLEEFDYPQGDENVRTSYAGIGGIQLTFLNKFLMAYRLGSIKLLITDYITDQSRIMIHRNVIDRADTIAPFLAYDDDPYIVLADGRLYWMLDAYIFSDRYPYSEPLGNFNYIRNPVKVVINAYDGRVTYYVVGEDPLIKAYMNIFPDLFRPLEDMPSQLQLHMRYPVGLFNVQAQIYKNYHMTDPQVFYNREDAWDVTIEIYEGQKQSMDPYYVIMKPPTSIEGEEFMLIQPFTPRSKNNMIAWMCAKSDLPNYGQMAVFKFPKDQLIYGPMQVEARVDQDTVISEQLTLWSQKGSRVIRGNLLVIPINNSLLYVEPLFLQADNSELPELKRVIVAYGDEVVMEESLEEALAQIFDLQQYVSTGTTEYQLEDNLSADELIQKAADHYQTAQELIRKGDWTGYGQETEQLGEVLEALEELSSASNK